MDIIKAKLDVVFKKLFTSDDEVLKGFISDMLDIPKADIGQITVNNPNILPSVLFVQDGKQAQLDLKLSVDDKIVNVEIQLCNKGNFPDRSVYYWSKMFSDELKKSEDYADLKRTICINILDFKLFDCDSAYSKFLLLEETRHELLTDKCAIMFLELVKVDEEIDKNDRRKLWLQLINAETEEELDMLEKTGVPEIQKAVVILHEMSADEEMREMARLREKAILDEKSAVNFARREGAEERESEIIARMRADGLTEEQIRKYIE